MARERLVKAVNRLGVVGRNGRSRKVGLALVLMVLVGGRASVRNAAETFELDYANLLEALGELDGAWRSCQTLKGQVVIVDDTVDHDAPGRREPPRTTGPTATPTGGSRGLSSSR